MSIKTNKYYFLIAAILVFISIGCSKQSSKILSPNSAVISVDPSIPDYDNLNHWAAHAKSHGASDSIPLGATISNQLKSADVFYIHPTTFSSDSLYNQSILDTKTNNWTDASVIARQASVFNDCCQIYAPRYRAASVLAVRDREVGGRGEKALDFAFSDVLRAFDHFIEHENNKRPFIIAGHSQGGLMVYRLLKERIDSSPLQERMIAAYAIGYNPSVGVFGRYFKTVKSCDKPLQTGCMLSWNSVTSELNVDMMSAIFSEPYVKEYNTTEGRELLCINPLTFDMEQNDADRSLSKGAVPGTPGAGPLEPIMSNKISASCTKGFLVVDVDPTLDLEPLPGGSMHYHDIGLFYEDIRQNAAARIASYIDSR